jgi:hypothetical protein
MGFDLRTPIGLLFTILGTLLTGYGLITHGSDMYACSLGMNINLGWGAVLLVFGLGMSWLARRNAPGSQRA